MENSDVHEEQSFFEAIESMMGSLADGFVLTDADSRVVYMNKAAEDIFQFRFQSGKNMYYLYDTARSGRQGGYGAKGSDCFYESIHE